MNITQEQKKELIDYIDAKRERGIATKDDYARPLCEHGLDDLDIVDLAVAIEQQFSIVIEDMHWPSRTDSINSILIFIEAQ